MWEDAIVEEVREARDRLAARFGYDLGALLEYLREREREELLELVSRGRSAQDGSEERPAPERGA